MASYHCHASIVKRSSGHSAVAAAAYRGRTDLTDERTGQRHDYTRAYGGTDLAFSGIFAPEDAPAWAHDRAQLWNHVEAFENRRNSQLARDFDIALAHELTEEQNRWALQDWVKENFTRRGLIADVAIHRPHEWGDERNIHAHVMVTMRQLDGEDFARHKDREANRPEQLEAWRESWAQHLSRHLRRHGHDTEADRMAIGHLRLTEQREIAVRRGDLAQAAELDREPTVHMGKAVMALERRGVETDRLSRQAEIIVTNEERAKAREAERAAAQEVWRGKAAAKLSGSPEIAAMREAWKWSDSNTAFLAALEEQGFAVGRVTEQEAQDSRERAEIATSHGHYSPQFEAGEFIAFNQRGRGYRLNGVTLDDAQAENRLQGFSEEMRTAAEALESVPDAPARSAEPKASAAQGRLAADAGQAGDKVAAISTQGIEGVARGVENAISGIADFLFGSSEQPQEPPTAPAAVHIPPSDAPAPSLARHVREVGKRAEKAGFSLDDAFAAYLVSHSQQLDPEITNTARRLREQQERDRRERDRDR